MRAFLITLLALIGLSTAFISPIHRAQIVKAASPVFVLRMSETDETPKPSSDTTFYDDEVDSTPSKPVISNAMRERLIAEASAGLDSDSKQPNVLLYIMGAVVILVALGGQGIFF
jgi:hypothetical protein